MATIAMETTKKHEQFKVHGIDRGWNIYESSPFSRKKFLSLCSIVKTTEWNGLIKIDN
jgi:hypothetical protein